MKQTILIALAIVLMIVIVSAPQNEAKASSSTLYTLQIFGPKNAGGCYSGPVSSNFTMISDHISFDLPAGTYTVCVQGGGQEVVVLPSGDQTANCNYNSSQQCSCGN